MTGAVRRHPLERLSEQRQLAVPAHDRRVESPMVAGGAGRRRPPVGTRGRLLLALGRDRIHRLRPDRVTGQSERLLADEDLAGSGGLLETSRGVDRIPGHQRLSGRGIARDDLARVDADPRRERDAAVALEFLVQVPNPSRISTAARTARRASSSCTFGIPKTDITASPMNFSTVPP